MHEETNNIDLERTTYDLILEDIYCFLYWVGRHIKLKNRHRWLSKGDTARGL